MILPRARPDAGARAALLVGVVVSLVAAVDLVRWMRPGLLLDPDPSWAWPRLLLGLSVAVGAAVAGGLAVAGFRVWSGTRRAAEPLEPLPFRPITLVALCAAAVLVGASLRFVALARVPASLWVDDLSLIRPALALHGGAADFADSVRAAPYGVAKPYGTVGVLYLEGYRAALRLWGTTVVGIRFPSAAAGALSLATAALLGRALLPAGGGALTALVLAGMRWQLILSRWAWVMIVLAPIVDLATLIAVAARRRRSAALAALAGTVAGVGAHVYLAAWVAAAALALWLFWPMEAAEPARPRLARSAAMLAGFSLVAAPLFLLREGRTTSYFARTADRSVFVEMARTKSILPPFAAAADALAAPWLLSDPTARHDLPGRMRLGWMLGIPVAVALGRALLRPRDAISGLLLSHGLAAAAAVTAGGQADNPNGSRFGYLTSVAALAAAAGILWLVAAAPRAHRRAAAIAAVGVLLVVGAFGARDALAVWPSHRATFDGFHGQDTLIGRAAARWAAFGEVAVEHGLGHSPITIEAVARYRLDPDASPATDPAAPRGWRLRLVRPGTPAGEGERIVEMVDDRWGRPWAVVVAKKGST